jgi:hypothetical protein
MDRVADKCHSDLGCRRGEVERRRIKIGTDEELEPAIVLGVGGVIEPENKVSNLPSRKHEGFTYHVWMAVTVRR